MSEENSGKGKNQDTSFDSEPKWDYTTSEQTRLTGFLVVGLNLVVVILFILDRTVPAVHSFITGKPV